MGTKLQPMYKDYADYVLKVGHGQLDGIAVTHDGYPLSAKEEKFINEYILTGKLNSSLKTAGLQLRNVASKDYIADEIAYRVEQIRKATIADADEILQYLTRVMRNEEKDQFNLDAPLGERTAAARELAKRIIDVPMMEDKVQPEIKITLNFEGLNLLDGDTTNESNT